MANRLSFTNHTKTVGTALSTFKQNHNLDTLINTIIELKPLSKIPSSKPVSSSPSTTITLPPLEASIQTKIANALQKLMHLGEISQMIQLAENLSPPDVWIFHSHQMPTDSKLQILAKSYSKTSNIFYKFSSLF